MIQYKEFETKATLEVAGRQLLEEAFTAEAPVPRAVMLTGGNTPFGIYHALASSGIRAAADVHILVSDERYVPLETGDSNYGRMKGMLDALGIKKRHVVDSSVPPAIAAARYANEMAHLVKREIPITLAVLGLGADGHIAALFREEHVVRSRGKYAVAVNRPDGMTGISLSADMLSRAEHIVFWVCGEGKRKAVDALLHKPDTIPAGIALEEARQISLWYSPQG